MLTMYLIKTASVLSDRLFVVGLTGLHYKIVKKVDFKKLESKFHAIR